MKIKRVLTILLILPFILLINLSIKPKAEDIKIEFKKLLTEVLEKPHYNKLSPLGKFAYGAIHEYFTISDLNEIKKNNSLDEPNLYFIFNIKRNTEQSYKLNEVNNAFLSAMSAYLTEHKELFMFTGNFSVSTSSNGTEHSTTFQLQLFLYYEHINLIQQDYLEYLDEITKITKLIKLLPLDNDYLKVRLIHDYIITNNEYNINATKPKPSAKDKMAHSPISALLKKYDPVCEGYAELFNILMNIAGVKSVYATGNAGENHAWNFVSINNKWYQIDLTFNDPVYDNGNTHHLNRVHYIYFLTPYNHDKKRKLDDKSPLGLVSIANKAREYYWDNQSYYADQNKYISLKASEDQKYLFKNGDYLFKKVYKNLAASFDNNFDAYLIEFNKLNKISTKINYNYQLVDLNAAYNYLYVLEPKKALKYIDFSTHFFRINETLNLYEQLYNEDSKKYDITSEDGEEVLLKEKKILFNREASLNEIIKEINANFNGYKLVGFYKRNGSTLEAINSNTKLKDIANLKPNDEIVLAYKKITITVNGEVFKSNFNSELFKDENIVPYLEANELFAGFKNKDNNTLYKTNTKYYFFSDVNLEVVKVKAKDVFTFHLLSDDLKSLLGYTANIPKNGDFSNDTLYFSSRENIASYELPYSVVELKKNDKDFTVSIKGYSNKLTIKYEIIPVILTVKENDTILKEYTKLPCINTLYNLFSTTKGLIREIVYKDSENNIIKVSREMKITSGTISITTLDNKHNIPLTLLNQYKMKFLSPTKVQISVSKFKKFDKDALKTNLKGYTIEFLSDKKLKITNDKYGTSKEYDYEIKNTLLASKTDLKIWGAVGGGVLLFIILVIIISKVRSKRRYRRY